MRTAGTRCKATAKSSGRQCGNPPIKGGTVCEIHGGSAPAVRARAGVRAELANWGLGDACADPGEVLLRLVTQSAARAQRYAAELEDLVAESESLRKALIGEAWGEFGQVGEYVRGLAQLEAAERDRCANFATKAIAAGLAERQVRLAERQGAVMAEVIRRILADLGVADGPQVAQVVSTRLREVTAGVA